MKKLLSLFLVIVMLFAIVSCDFILPSDSDTDTDKQSNNGSNSGSNSGNKPSTDSDTPTFTEDMTIYRVKTNPNGTIVYSTETLDAPSLTKYYHGYKAAISMTFDDGDHIGTGHTLNELFAKYGFRGTLMVCAGNVENNVSEWQAVLDEGYLDLGCHGYNHTAPTSIGSGDSATLTRETIDAVEFLRNSFRGQRVLTFATPYANITDEYESYLEDLVIANRLESGGGYVTPGEDYYNMYRIHAASFNMSKTSMFINSKADEAYEDGLWLVELMHGVVDNERYGTDILRADFEAHCEYLYNNYNGKIWFGSFEDVAIYVKQYENSKITYTACDRESMTFKIETTGLDKDVYNIPMSAKIYLPTKTDSAYYVINGKEYDCKVNLEGTRGKKYVEVLDIPNDGTEVKIYFGNNSKVNNGCFDHRWTYETIESTCETHGYHLYTCSICGHSYKKMYRDLKHDFTGETFVQNDRTYVKCKLCDKTKEIVE